MGFQHKKDALPFAGGDSWLTNTIKQNGMKIDTHNVTRSRVRKLAMAPRVRVVRRKEGQSADKPPVPPRGKPGDRRPPAKPSNGLTANEALGTQNGDVTQNATLSEQEAEDLAQRTAKHLALAELALTGDGLPRAVDLYL